MSRTMEAARGKWRGILMSFDIERSFLTGKHGPCPMCGGTDRFRFDDKEGRGTYFCSGCGAGTGMDLIQKIKGWDFKTAAGEVDRIVGNVRPERIKPQRSPEQTRRSSADLWNNARRVVPGDPVSLYLEHRGWGFPQNMDSIRFAPTCPVPGGSQCTAMLAKVSDIDGKGVTVHRTFLTAQGRKAAMDEPRATMPGSIPDGAAIRLAMHGERLGIAEGIETALGATKRFGIPVWAAINATMLSKWQPPEGVREVVIFADNDANYAGLLAAAALANRLTVRCGLSVTIEMPERVGMDWADAA
jgi:putative DNA primase/helicase